MVPVDGVIYSEEVGDVFSFEVDFLVNMFLFLFIVVTCSFVEDSCVVVVDEILSVSTVVLTEVNSPMSFRAAALSRHEEDGPSGT